MLSKLFLKNDELIAKVFKGTVWLTFGSIFARILISLSYVVLARILTQKENGQFGMLKSTIDNFMIFATVGLGLSVTKFVSESRNKNKKFSSEIIGLSLVSVLGFGLLVCIGFYFQRDKILANEINPNILFVVSIILVLNAFNSVQTGALIGLQSFKSISLINICQGFLFFLFVSAGSYWFGVKGAIIGNLFALILLVTSCHFILIKELRKEDIAISFSNWKTNSIKLWKFALPSSLSTLITAPTIWILNSMLTKQLNGYEQLGIYSVVLIVSNSIQILESSLGNVLLPILLTETEKKSSSKEFLNYFGTWIASIALSIPFFLYPEAVSFILGKKYPIETILPILMLSIFSVLIIGNRQGLARDLIVKNKMWLSVYSMGQWAITTFICFKMLGNDSAIKLAVSFLIGYLTNMLLFVPIYIQLKISPKYIFFNYKVFFIWFCLASMCITTFYLSNLFLRIPLIFLFVFILYKIFNGIYVEISKKGY